MLALQATAQSPVGTTYESYARARKVLEAGIEAMGGLNRLREIEDMTILYHGKRYMLNQSLSPGGPLDVEPSSGTIVVDARQGRLFAESMTTYKVDGRFLRLQDFGRIGVPAVVTRISGRADSARQARVVNRLGGRKLQRNLACPDV